MKLSKINVHMESLCRISYILRSTWGAHCADMCSLFQLDPLGEKRWSSKVANHQETSATKVRQMKKREAERDIREAPPQSSALSYRDEKDNSELWRNQTLPI